LPAASGRWSGTRRFASCPLHPSKLLYLVLAQGAKWSFYRLWLPGGIAPARMCDRIYR
jgi:hypothetical protein